ncbi:hypothetical protein [Rhodopila sp.]|uniref:hypothetical protein n=1 Tax=Rhodopila sp. TaxID=2480087 RepID=UPI003D116DF5
MPISGSFNAYLTFSQTVTAVAYIVHQSSYAYSVPFAQNDGAAVLIVNNSASDLIFRWGIDARAVVAENLAGVFRVPAGQSTLWTELDFGQGQAPGLSPSVQLPTFIAMAAPLGGGKVTIFRGQTSIMRNFPITVLSQDPSDGPGLPAGGFLNAISP